MGAPFTQVEIQAEIDNCKTELRTAINSQKYAYDEGPVGQFAVEKGDVKKIKEVMQFWIDMMNEYFPDAFSVQPQIDFDEIGYLGG